jgi:hypothetical protein
MDFLNKFFDATPLIPKYLTLPVIHVYIEVASDYPPQKRLGMKTKPALLIGLLVLIAQLPVFAAKGPAAVNEKLILAFQHAFPQAEKVVWKENEDYYFVYFRDHDIQSEIEYDHEGNFIGSQRSYKSVDLLPLHLAWELHNKFTDKTIFGITEVNADSQSTYYIKLVDDKKWITLKGFADGTLEVVEKFDKQQ